MKLSLLLSHEDANYTFLSCAFSYFINITLCLNSISSLYRQLTPSSSKGYVRFLRKETCWKLLLGLRYSSSFSSSQFVSWIGSMVIFLIKIFIRLGKYSFSDMQSSSISIYGMKPGLPLDRIWRVIKTLSKISFW